jgi:hypothetical protein
MKRTALFVVVSLALSSLALAQEAKKESKSSMTGYVVDAMCAKGMAKKESPMEAAAKHTKDCALEEGCAASGYGVFSDGKWYKFDENGDKLAKDLIEKSKTEKGLMIEVTGEMKGDKLAVATINEHKAEAKPMEKKEETEEHKH